jgi:arylsulfatase A-like enzyme
MPKTSKPNILVIWGDDIGQSNLSCYTHGLMGYRMPNIDRIAKEGMLFTDSFGEAVGLQSDRPHCPRASASTRCRTLMPKT